MFKKPILVALLAIISIVGLPAAAFACGCFHQPEPPPMVDGAFAVNQNSEQIIFEVNGDGTITAHVSIKYEGDPAQFGWLVPVPSPPDLALSEGLLFSILDQFTAPVVTPVDVNACPTEKYFCDQHPSCPPPNSFNNNANNSNGFNNNANNFNNVNNSNGGVDGEPVEVVARQVIGSYDTVTFAADEAAAAVQWLEDNGFIVNQTMTPFLQPYLDAGMYIVASRLVPGAGVDEIRPLKMTYNAENPMVPLKLTAIAAQPELTVTTYIMGESVYGPSDQSVIRPEAFIDDLSQFDGRSNYPMVISRAIDEAGPAGAFIREYGNGFGNLVDFAYEQCCQGGDDFCGVSGNGACECPGADYDRDDCAGLVDADEYNTAYTMFEELRNKHQFVTRLTTRLSPKEMTFDPMFEPRGNDAFAQRLITSPEVFNIDSCSGRLVDDAAETLYESVRLKDPCTTTYCGAGTCRSTPDGTAAMCECPANFVSQQFIDLDGLPSVTCVPNEQIVDLSAGGITLPDACKGRDCGDGTCVDIQGFATCECASGSAAVVVVNGAVPMCETAGQAADAGARNYSDELLDVPVCDPTPPVCGAAGWLVEVNGRRFEGVECEEIDSSRFTPPPPPICSNGRDPYGQLPDGAKAESDGCGQVGFAAPAGGAFFLILALFGLIGRRRDED